jgi:hypothetical protein
LKILLPLLLVASLPPLTYFPSLSFFQLPFEVPTIVSYETVVEFPLSQRS